MKKDLPIGISEFKKLIEGNYLYVDKTKIIYELIKREQFFLSRPRRFGKSLLISTLDQLFLGNKELFKNTWIYNSDYDWKKYPVIRLNFSGMNHHSGAGFELSLLNALNSVGRAYGFDLSTITNLEDKLTFLMEELSKQNSVVILIDEYDHPLISNVGEKELGIAQEIQRIMQGFFATVKATEPYMRFCFMTGVSRFSKTSIFSGMNNLNDITMDPIAADLLGYTQQELESNYQAYVEVVAQEQSKTVDTVYAELKTWYNGYRFSDVETKVYNPFSIINALFKKRLVNYWLNTGTPSFIVKVLHKYISEFETLKTTTYTANALLTSFEIGKLRLDLLLYQAGYLTISDYHDGIFWLDFPNQEVAVSFNEFLMGYFMEKDEVDANNIARRAKAGLKEGKVQIFYDELKAVIASIPGILQDKNQRESYYHMLIHMFLRMIGLPVQSEILVSTGRLDLALETSKCIYIFEVKLNQSPEIALKQIEEKRYSDAFMKLGKQIVLVGLNFDNKNKELQTAHKIVH